MRLGHVVAAAGATAAISMASWAMADSPPPDAPHDEVVTSVAGAVAPVIESVAIRSDATTTLQPAPLDTVPPSTTAVPINTVPINDVEGISAAFLADINAARSEVGLTALSRDADLDAMARSWAETMAADESLRHSELIHTVIAGTWTAAGENIAYGPSETSMFAGLDASAGHRANMVNDAYSHVGIGVVAVGPALWTAHLFAG
jgi:uncharacterized protein YkwD